MSRFFFDQRQTLVDDAIEGFLFHHQDIVKLDANNPTIRVLLRKSWDKSKVAIISGGGSGHEPAHIGFIGKGILTAAVCGDLFASPSVNAILSAIIAVTGEAGCLLIVKNYTGDRLNFGLAAEKAKQLGYKVDIIVVGDDIALDESKQARGLAGTIFIHKIAGALSESGKQLSDIKREVEAVNATICTLAVSMSGCHLPEVNDVHHIPDGSIEVGLGIHGESGASILKTRNSHTIIEYMLEKLNTHIDDKSEIAVIINNLGGVSQLEINVLTKALCQSQLGKRMRLLIGPACLMTALDMKGFSLSILPLTPLLEETLLAHTTATAWTVPVKPNLPEKFIFDSEAIKTTFSSSDNEYVYKIIHQITRRLIELEKNLNALDSKVGDGDTGTTFTVGAKTILNLLEDKKLPLADMTALFTAIGHQLAENMGGSSGVLLSILFTAASQAYAQNGDLAESLLSGVEKMKHYGGAKLGDRTLIDALQPALESFSQYQDIAKAAEAGKKGAESTALITKTNVGRSSYINAENLQGQKDPGAVAIAEVFISLAELT